LVLDGLPVYIAGSVATESDLPEAGESIGASYVVGNDEPLLAVWIGKWIFYGQDGGEPPRAGNTAAMDAGTINHILQQAGFPTIP
jgi:hypothetical protein